MEFLEGGARDVLVGTHNMVAVRAFAGIFGWILEQVSQVSHSPIFPIVLMKYRDASFQGCGVRPVPEEACFFFFLI